MYRIGFSKDIHLLKPGEGITLGGIKIKCPLEVNAYSDGDVLLHSLCEALYGAMGMEDLGTYFSDKNYPKNFSSKIIAEDVKKHLLLKNYKISNVDITIVVDEPHLKSHKKNIKTNLCEIFQISSEQVAVKATNTDNIEINRIQVYSNVLIYKGEN